MKYIFASDIHGSAFYCKKLLDVFEHSGAEQMILMGDLLYHGARNDLPEEYGTKDCTQLLNDYTGKIIAWLMFFVFVAGFVISILSTN